MNRSFSQFSTAAIFVLLILIFGCKKNNTDSASTRGLTTENDTLSDATADFIASLPDTTISLRSVYLDDSETVYGYLQTNDPNFLQNYPSASFQPPVHGSVSVNSTGIINHPNKISVLGAGGITAAQQLRLFISREISVANYLVTRINFVSSTGQKNGLGYMTGSKDYDAPHAPPKPVPPNYNPGCQGVSLYGLDCSGLIYQITTKSFLVEVVPKSLFGVSNLNDTSKWNQAFKKTPDYDSLVMEDKGYGYPINQMQTGDLFLWIGKDAHTGIYINGRIYESGGSASYPGCTHDLDANRGPKTIPVSACTSINGGVYKIFRPRAAGPTPPGRLTGTYNLTMLRGQGTPGIVQMGLIVNGQYKPQGDPQFWSVKLDFIDPPPGSDLKENYYRYTSYDTAGVPTAYVGNYSIEPWEPDNLFLPVCQACGYTENHPPYGWGYLFPPGFKIILDFDADANGRLSRDLSKIEVVQSGHMVLTK